MKKILFIICSLMLIGSGAQAWFWKKDLNKIWDYSRIWDKKEHKYDYWYLFPDESTGFRGDSETIKIQVTAQSVDPTSKLPVFSAQAHSWYEGEVDMFIEMILTNKNKYGITSIKKIYTSWWDDVYVYFTGYNDLAEQFSQDPRSNGLEN